MVHGRGNDEEPKRRRWSAEMQQELLSKNLVALQLYRQDTSGRRVSEPPYLKNYYSVRPFGPFGPNHIIHGRELFPTPASAAKFPQIDEIPPAVIESVMDMLRPESLDKRIHSYSISGDHVKYVTDLIREMHEKFPQLELDKLLPVKRMRAYKTYRAVLHALEEAKIDEKEYIFSDTHKQQQYDEFAQMASAYFDKMAKECIVSGEVRQSAIAMKDEVLAYAAQYHSDPEILRHFCLGMEEKSRLGAASPDSLEDIVALGMRVRAQSMIAQAAHAMDNPYLEVFDKKAEDVSRELVKGVPLRQMYNALKHNTLFVVSETGSLFFSDINQFPDEIFSGRQSMDPSLILITYNPSDPFQLRRIAQHEVAHLFDHTHEKTFVEKHTKESLSQEMQRDFEHFKKLEHLILRIRPDSPEEDMEKFMGLAKLLFREPETMDFAELREITEETMLVVSEWFDEIIRKNPKRLPSEDKMDIQEIPARMAHLTGDFREDFMQAVLPELFKACREHNLTHPSMPKRFGVKLER